jgi:hypothetical protein
MKLDENGNLPLSDEGGFDDFLDWFSSIDGGMPNIDFKGLKRAIAKEALDEFLRDIDLWLTNEGVDISSNSSSTKIIVVPWDQLMVLGSRRLIKKKFDSLMERDREDEGDEDENDATPPPVSPE